jgi:TolB-like protein/DNA-binding winged helix-turn-helix (wHTH) protein/Flp pilus assembly protein TadD
MLRGDRELYEFLDFRLDVSERLFLCKNERIHLSDKTFEILCLLVRQNGHLVGKTEILEQVWADTVVEENNLDKSVSRLRKALGKGNEKFIETVRGHGYRFVAEVRKIEVVADFQDLNGGPSDFKPEADRISPQFGNHRAARSNKVIALADWRPEPDTPEKPLPAVLPVVESGKSSSLSTRKNLRLFGAIVSGFVLLALGFYAVNRFGLKSGPADMPIKTLAVLPFKPLAAENRNESLELGMTDTLINKLSCSSEIIVRPLGSVRKFNNLEQDSLAAGRELGVDSVLDGNIQMAGDRIRINSRLVRTSDGKQLWTGQFDEKFTDIFAVQNSISERVATALKIQFVEFEKKRYTDNVEAYQLYLKGRFHQLKLKRSEIQKGILYYQQAIELDPTHALAYVGLAEGYRALALTGEMPSNEFLPKAKMAANKAIEIDDGLAQAHAELGFIIMRYDWNWSETENQCRRALELDPNNADAHQTCAQLLSITGRHAEALPEIKRARELDPLNLRISTLEAVFLSYAGQNDEALASLQKVFELDPDFWFAHHFAASAYIDKGMYAEAIVEARRAQTLSAESSQPASLLGYALAKSGNEPAARSELEALLKLSTERYIPPYHIAFIYNGLNDRDKTLEWLEKGYQQRDPRMVFLKVEPKWNNLRNEPRFIDLLQRMNFEQK